jgi:hypothetical protein
MTTKWSLAALAGGSLAVVVAIAAYGPAKASFVAQCWQNGRPVAECACMHHAHQDFLARRDLPAIYGQLAKAWAHDPEADYRNKVYTTMFWQSVRAIPVVRDVLLDGGKEASDGVWGRVTKGIGEQILMQIGQRLGVTILPWVHTAKTAKEVAEPVWDYAKAQAVVSKHCGGRAHAIVSSLETAQSRVLAEIDTYRGAIGDLVGDARRLLMVETIKAKTQEILETAAAQTKSLYQRARDKVLGWAGQ